MAVREIKPSDTFDLNAGASYVGGVAPSDGDTIRLRSGRAICTASWAALSAFATGISIIVDAGASLTIGDATNALDVKLVNVQANGTLNMVQTKAVAALALYGAGSVVSLQSGNLTTLLVAAGSLSVAAAANLGTVIVDGSGTFYAPPSSGSDRIDALYALGGQAVVERNVDLGVVSNGLVTMRQSATFADGSTTGRLRLLSPAARVQMENTAGVTIDNLDAYAGTLDPSRINGNLTVTNSVRTGRAKLVNTWAGGSTTYTNTPTDLGYGTYGASLPLL